MELKLVIDIEDGKLPADADLVEFKKQVSGQLRLIADNNRVNYDEQLTPAPDGTLGVEQAALFIIENFDQIVAFTKHMAIICTSTNALAQVLLGKNRKQDESDKGDGIKIKISFGSESLEIPANAKEIDKFVSKFKSDNATEDQ